MRISTLASSAAIALALLLSPPVRGQSTEPYAAAKSGGNYMHNFYVPPAAASTPWWPSWSPDGRYLAFAMHGSIWKLRVAGLLRPGNRAGAEAIAEEWITASEHLSSPEWSPDGRWLAYTADDGEGINLRLLEIATGKSTSLTTGNQLNLDPAWSPDSKRLAYVSTEPIGYFNIYVAELDGPSVVRRTAVTTDHRFGRDRLYFADNDIHISPTWSPDGKELIFISNRGIPLGSGAIWRAPAESDVMNRGLARIIHKEETLYRTRPHWSPDGKRIVYSSHLGHQYNNLFVLPAVGGEPYKMTFGEHDTFHPRWSPDGEWIACISNEDGLPQLKLLKSWGGLEQLVKVAERRWSRPMGRVRVRVLDAATGRPVSARIYPRASDGKAYTPPGSYERISSLQQRLFHTSGTFTTNVPPGPYTVEAVRGFEHWPARETLEVRAGQTHDLTLRLKRMVNLKADGWYSGSNHVHMNYAGNLHNTPENLMLMHAAEDADMVGHQIANKDNRILDYQYFVPGRDHHPLSTRARILHTGQEYRPPFYGHISLLNLRDHLISPFTTGYEGTAIESLYPSNTDVFRFAREQGAIGAYVHPYAGDRDPIEGELGVAKAFPVDVALGAVSYHELWSNAGEASLRVWHHVLNNGFKVPVTGGEDSISSLHRTRLVGATRGYFLLGPGQLSWKNYMAALLKGRGFVTNGPLLRFRLERSGALPARPLPQAGAPAPSATSGRFTALPGDEVHLPSGGGTLRLSGRLDSIVPIDRLEIVCNGLVLHSVPLEGDRRRAVFDKEVHVTTSGWYTLQAIANARTHPVEDTRPMATTNPIYVYVGDTPIRNRASAQYFVRWIDKLAAMAEKHPGWRSDLEKDHVLSQFREARAIYLRLSSE